MPPNKGMDLQLIPGVSQTQVELDINTSLITCDERKTSELRRSAALNPPGRRGAHGVAFKRGCGDVWTGKASVQQVTGLMKLD